MNTERAEGADERAMESLLGAGIPGPGHLHPSEMLGTPG